MEGDEDDERRHADKFHSEVSFELGSKHQGRSMMIKQEPGSREGVGGDGGMYELIDFSEVDNDDMYVTPDEDPLSLDQVTRHCNVVDRRKATVKTPRDVPKTQSGFRAEPAQNSMPVTTMGNGSEMRNEMEEIEAIIDESEMQLEAEVSDVKVKTEFIGMPSDVNNQESPNVSNNSKEVINTVRKEKRRTWLCTICNVGFPTEQLYIFHMKATHSDKFPHACRHCGKRFAKQNEKKKHETIHDPNRFKGEPKYACEFCDKRYHIKVSLEGHRKVTHLGYIKPNKRVSSAPVTQHHSKGIRKPEPEVKVEKVLYPCTECDLRFDQRCSLKKHMRVHTGETPYSCHICQQPFKHSGSLRTHVKNVHENPSKRPRPSKPRFMFKNSWPCNVCDRVFKLPSRLTKHMTLHTGEKEFECDKCGNRFRTAQCLQTHLKRHKLKEKKEKPFKCRYCGKFFVMFNELNNHRVQKHRNIPIPENREVEKTFGCGICGKPYYTKNQAMICAILRHDPTSLLEAMFKHKCPECPEERFGHRNLITLRKHWQEEHAHITLPAEFRKGLYQDVQDSLPNVKLDKEKARDIRENGTTVKYEYPLYVEFELLDVEEQFLKKPKKKVQITRKHATCECTVCGFTLLRHNLKRHMQLHTNPKGQRRAAYVCGICNRHFRKIKTLRQHEKVCQTSGLPKRRPGRPKRSPVLCIKGEPGANVDSLPIPDNLNEEAVTVAQNVLAGFNEFPGSVNLNDRASIQSVLGGKTLRIILSHVTFKEAASRHEVNLSESEDDDGAKTITPKTVNIHDVASINSILGNKELRICLQKS